MELLGYQYSQGLEELHNTLTRLFDGEIRVEDIREDEDKRIRAALGVHKRNPDGSISIKFNPENPDEADIAHEYLHAIFQEEGYPVARYYGFENRDIEWLRIHIEDSVIHPLIYRRSEELGFPIQSQRARIIPAYTESLGRCTPENTKNVIEMQICAFQMLLAMQLDKSCEGAIREATSENLPETFSIFQEYKSIVPLEGVVNRRKCQRCILRLIEVCGSQFRKYANEDAHLRERFYSLPLYISSRDANRPARELTNIWARDRVTDGVQWFDICVHYRPENRLIGGASYREKAIRDTDFEVCLSLHSNSSIKALLEQQGIAYRIL